MTTAISSPCLVLSTHTELSRLTTLLLLPLTRACYTAVILVHHILLITEHQISLAASH